MDQSMSLRGRRELPVQRRVAVAALLICAAVLSGCSSVIEDHLPTAAGGLPDNAPPRPTAETDYPAVHNMPPARATTPLSYDQQKRLEDDLIAARNKYGTKDDTPAATGSTPNGSLGNGPNADGKAGSVQNP
jgi:hypothetical protein